MQPLNYREAFGSRWPLLLVLAILGGLVGILLPVSTGGSGALKGPLAPRYSAASTVAAAPGQGSGSASTSITPAQVLADVHSTPVEAAAAKQLGYPEPTQVGQAVTLVPAGGSSGELTASAATVDRAVTLANAYTTALLDFLSQTTAAAQAQAVTTDKAAVDSLQNQINAVEAQVAALPAASRASPQSDPQAALLQAQSQALVTAYGTAFQTYTQLAAAPPPGPGLTVVQPASAAIATRIPPPKVSRLDSRRVRGPLGLAVGLVLGALIVLVLEQLDRRIRTREEAELAFGLPVLAEVPRYRLTRSARDVVIQSASMSMSAEAYRSLRTLLLAGRTKKWDRALPVPSRPNQTSSVVPAETGGSGNALPMLRFSRPSPVNAVTPFVLGVVCSEIERTRPAAVGNLAAAFAEQGRSVLILAVDRRPPDRPDADTDAPGPRTLEDVTRPSVVRGVRRAVLSSIAAEGGDRTEEMRILIDDARRSADVVILDITPVLLAHDASALAEMVDSMVIVAEGRRTTRDQARRCSEVLARVEAPVVGVLLTQAAVHRSKRGSADYRWSLDSVQSNGSSDTVGTT